MNKSIIALAVIMLTSCDSIEIQYPESEKVGNCVDWVVANHAEGDTIKYGRYGNDSNGGLHLWLSRDDVCYDNMNPQGFDCSDERYTLYSEPDFSEQWQIDFFLAMRPEGYRL